MTGRAPGFGGELHKNQARCESKARFTSTDVAEWDFYLRADQQMELVFVCAERRMALAGRLWRAGDLPTAGDNGMESNNYLGWNSFHRHCGTRTGVGANSGRRPNAGPAASAT